MLVVIVIIGILTALVMSGIMKAGESSKIQATRAIAKQISAGLDSYQNRFGDYPPTSLEAFKVILPNDINNGIETLVACLATNNGGPFYQFDESFLMNSDGDKVSKNITNWFFGDNQLREVVDNWGNPFIYFHFRDYQKPSSKILKYKMSEGIEECKPSKSGATATFHNPNSFQIWSAGPNGKNENGGGDDITGW